MVSLKEKGALRRYQAVCAVTMRVARGESLRRACECVSKMEFYDAHLRRNVSFSPSSLRRWVRAFEAGGIEALQVSGRNRPQKALPADLIEFIRAEKTLDAEVSIPQLIRRIKLRKDLPEHATLSRTTVWRAVARLGLPTRRKSEKGPSGDCRAFEFVHRMQCLLCDGKHFTVGPGRIKRVALIMIDDATRRVIDVAVGTSESTALFIRVLARSLRRAGMPIQLFMDNGPGFRSEDTALVCGRLKITKILGTPEYPQGRGKIERFNRTLEADLLRGWRESAETPTDLASLELRLRHFCLEVYNKQKHKALHGLTPDERWLRDMLPLKPVSEEVLTTACLISRGRVVSNHHLVSVKGTFYEMPMGTAGCHVVIEEDLLSGSVFYVHQGERIRLHEPDKHANALQRRSARPARPEEPRTPLPPSAADLQFLRDHTPITDPDGGFKDDK